MPFSFTDKNVLITGGASGIGKIMLRKALEKGASSVVVWDIDNLALEKVVDEFSAFKGAIYTIKCDLNNSDDILQAYNSTIAKVNTIHCIINNAGIVTGKMFVGHSIEEIRRTMQVNAVAPMELIRHFLPQMMEQNNAVICNISSMASLGANPKMSVYCASKWALSGWSESLRIEMEEAKKNISVTTIMPYYISTGMFEGVHSKLIKIAEPEDVAEKIIKSIEKRKTIVTIGLPYWFVRLSQGIFPMRVYDWVAENIFGIYSSMNHFKGRSS